MRLAFLSAFPPYRGGISQFSAALVRELRKTNEVAAFTFKRQYPGILFPGTSQYDRATPDDIGAKEVLDSIGPWSWGHTAKQLLATGPEVVVLRYWMPFFAPALGCVAGQLRRKGVKVLSIVDNALPHEPHFYDRPLTRWFLRRNDGLIAMAQAVKEDVLAMHPQAKVELLPHPLYDHFGTPVAKEEARRKLGLPGDTKVLLFFGLIRDYKGLDLLLQAFDALDGSFHLVVAGEPYGDFGKYRELIGANRNAERIHLHTRFIPDVEVPLFFGAADAVVLPYRSATQSGVTAIAYHFGLPVVATDVGGLRETLYDGRTGVLVPRPDADAIAEGISALFARDRHALAAQIALVREELSWPRFAARLVDFVRTL